MKKFSHGCTLDCADCCKFNIYLDDENSIKIEGDKDHPYTKGFICKKGLAHLDRLNHKDRIYKPLLKVDGEWTEITFDEALEIMVDRLNRYKSKYTSQSIMYYEQYGNGSLLKSIGEIFFNFYGGATFSKGGPCWSAGIAAQKLDFGDVSSHSLEDMMNSKNIFIWGKNPSNTTIHTMYSIKKAKANGSRVVVIDPICTETAKAADKYIRIKPNGDLSLALAIGKIIVEKGLFDEKYIDKNVNGFKNYKNLLDSLDINSLSEQCGISINEIEELSRIYCEKYSTILLGYGIQKYDNGGNTIRAIDALGAITGQIGFSGGGVNYANKSLVNILNTDPYNSKKNAVNRYFYTSHLSKFIRDSIDGNAFLKNNIYNPDNDVDNIPSSIPLKMAVICKSNLINQLPDLNSLKEEFSKIEFKVCFDMFMTDTARECDLFIPTTCSLESEDIIFSSMMNPYLIYNEKIVDPADELMDEYYFFMELSKRLNIYGYPYVNKNEYLSMVIEPLKEIFHDISLEKIKREYISIHDDIAWKDKKFLTSSGRFELGVEPRFSLVSKENKFRLLTTHSRDTLFSQHMMDTEGISKAYINSKVAGTMTIKDKEIVLLKSDSGMIKSEVNIDDSISDDVVMMYIGWWTKHGNPNYLTFSRISDLGGQIAYNETFVEIEKIK